MTKQKLLFGHITEFTSFASTMPTRLIFEKKAPPNSFIVSDKIAMPTAENLDKNKAKEAFNEYWEKKYPKIAEEKALQLYQDKPLLQACFKKELANARYQVWDYFELNFSLKAKERAVDEVSQKGAEQSYKFLLRDLSNPEILVKLKQLVDEGFLPLSASTNYLDGWEPYEDVNFKEDLVKGGHSMTKHQRLGLKAESRQESLKYIGGALKDLDFSSMPGGSGAKEAAKKILEQGRKLGVPVNFEKAFEQITREIYPQLELAEAENLISGESPLDAHVTEKEFNNILQGEDMKKAAKKVIANMLKKFQTKTDRFLNLEAKP